ncbi:hypothetical protein F4680DRAFT_449042 [Xylaria scruposa]|nr:hypothetical protein F4680DRAFT_449042 [Xylaria scruposa]
MSLSQRHQGRSQLTSLYTILLLALAVFATSGHTATIATKESPNLERRQGMTVGSSCAGSEGQWNCMTSSFQRCGSGQWSEVQQCALGTQCSPSGLTYQFHVDFADGYYGAAPPPSTSGGARIRDGRIGWWLLGGIGVFAVVV